MHCNPIDMSSSGYVNPNGAAAASIRKDVAGDENTVSRLLRPTSTRAQSPYY